jgi:hypothetical protein
MTIPLYLAIAQWMLLLALGLLVFIMYRQLGHIFRGPTTAAEFGPAVGTGAASFEYTRVSDGTRHHFTAGDGQAALVAFVDPTCPACESLVSNLNTAADGGELDELRVLLLTWDPPAYVQISDSFRATRLEIGRPVAHAAKDDYKVSATPLLVAIDTDGVVRAAGAVRHLGDLRTFISRASSTPRRAPAPIAIVATPTPGE